MNFRINSECFDQLEQFLQERNETNEGFDLPIKEVPFPDDKGKTYTCKFKTQQEYTNKRISSNLVACRTTPLSIERNERNTACENEKRIPSRCDRFLYNALESPKVLLQKSDVYIPESDHNALYLVISPGIRKVSLGGGKRRKTRKQKQKQKQKQKRKRLENTRKQK